MNGPCAQARRVKDIGLVLPKYYGKNGNTGRGRDSSAVYAHHHLSKGVSDDHQILFRRQILKLACCRADAHKFWYNSVMITVHAIY